MKLTTKVALIFGGGATVMIMVTSFLIFTSTRSILKKNISAQQTISAAETIDKIDRIFNNYLLTLQTMGEEEDFERFLGGEKNIQPEINRRMRELTFLTGPWDILFIVDRNGTIILSTHADEVGKSIKQEPISNVAYEKALGGGLYYSDMITSEDTGKPTVIFAAPIKSESGKRPVEGVIIGNMSWPVISEALNTSSIPGEFDLYNSKSILIATNRDNPLNLFNRDQTVENDRKRFNGKQNPFTTIGEHAGDSEPYLITHAPSLGFLSYKGNGWLLLAKAPTRVVFGPATDIALRTTAFMVSLIVLIIGLISFLFIKIFVRPVVALTNTATAIAKGDRTQRVAGSSNDEIGTLGKEFNVMTDTLIKDAAQISSISEELQKELNKSKALMESIGDGVVAIDRAWNIVLWNKTATEISGWSQNEALGKSFRDVVKFIRERDREENIMFIEEAMLHSKAFSMEGDTILIKKDGSEVPISDSAAPIIEHDGVVSGAIIIFRDASRERETHRLHSDFAYASHQIRTPVAKALWMLESALDKENMQEIKGQVSEAYQAIQSVNKLSEELIEVSRIDQKQVVVEKTDVELGDVLSGIVNDMAIKAKNKDVILEVHTVPDLIKITTSIPLLKKILQALIENAIIYCKEKSTVDVDATIDNNELLIRVSNIGFGILDEDQPAVFTKFFRGKNIDTTAIAGAGLGLYIARGYAKILGGRIWFDSKGDRVTFYVSLPIS